MGIMKPKAREDRGPKPPRRLFKRRERSVTEEPAQAQAPVAPPAPVELRPYGPPIKTNRFTRFLLISGALGFCFLYGLVFAFVAPYLMVQVALPLVILAALVLWALPETGKAPVRYLEILIFVVLIAQAMWPNYLAIALPGLPWITVQRLLGAALALTFLSCLSLSGRFRAELSAVLKSTPLLAKSLYLFVLIQAASIFLSVERLASANLYINVLTAWVCPFFVTCFICAKDGRIERFVGLVCVTAVLLTGLGLWEHHLGHVPWLGHVPSFLQVNDPNVQRFLAGTSRANGAHRVQTTFTTSLALSEYLALSLPFLLHFGAVKYALPIRVAAFAALPLVIYGVVITQARTGMVGVLVALSAYPVLRLFLFRRRNPQNIAASTALFLAPLAVAAFMAVAYVVPGLHVRIYGSGVTSYSNDARTLQYHMGMPKIFSQPWGYGIGRGSETLGYSGSFSEVYSIDIYPLRLALEYGVIGFVVYYLMIFFALRYSALPMFDSTPRTKEKMMFIPLGIAVLSFFMMQLFFALEDNQGLVFMLFGVLAALTYRHGKQRVGQPGLSV